ncbi:MAG: 3-deoxy-8-phosphooctulonate synthase [Elusimicrobia bacterium]|nr:3-deoxy-8-phosphooctulonate synthase [Elusimicrobiota bacterium]
MNCASLVRIGGVSLSNSRPLAALGGVCSIESVETTFQVARRLKKIFLELKIPFIFKASYDKANRSSIRSWRGLGMKRGLDILRRVRDELGVPVMTDVHDPSQAARAARVVDLLQIPAFLCRQTDLIVAAAQTGKPVNVKKGQFLSPWECGNMIEKALSTGNREVMLTERGYMFGYNNLVVDMRSFVVLKELGVPVIFDATHSQQLPGGLGSATGGRPEFIEPVSRSAAAVGIAGIFFEAHPQPDLAKSDGSNSIRLDLVKSWWETLMKIDHLVKKDAGGRMQDKNK